MLSGSDTLRANEFLKQALQLAESGLDKKDPANRALAVNGNNLACALEEKQTRTDDEKRLMILAANTGRKYWEFAGTWLEVSRAEYRLAMTYVKALDLTEALKHSQTCIELCKENGAGMLDLFYAYEVLAVVEKARDNSLGFEKALVTAERYFEQLSTEDKSWCEKSLRRLIS